MGKNYLKKADNSLSKKGNRRICSIDSDDIDKEKINSLLKERDISNHAEKRKKRKIESLSRDQFQLYIEEWVEKRPDGKMVMDLTGKDSLGSEIILLEVKSYSNDEFMNLAQFFQFLKNDSLKKEILNKWV